MCYNMPHFCHMCYIIQHFFQKHYNIQHFFHELYIAPHFFHMRHSILTPMLYFISIFMVYAAAPDRRLRIAAARASLKKRCNRMLSENRCNRML